MCHPIQWEVGLLSEWPSPRWDTVQGLTSLTYSWLVASPSGIAPLFASADIGKLKLFDDNFLLRLSCHWDFAVTLTGVSKGLLPLAKGATPDSGGQGFPWYM